MTTENTPAAQPTPSTTPSPASQDQPAPQPSDDIPYSEINVQGIIQIALNNVGVSQRDYEQAQAVILESQFNNQAQ